MHEPTLLIYSEADPLYGLGSWMHYTAMALRNGGYRILLAQPREESAAIEVRKATGIIHEFLAVTTGGDASRRLVERIPAAALIAKAAPDLILFVCKTPFESVAARETAVFLGIPFITFDGSADPEFVKGREVMLPKLAAIYGQTRKCLAPSLDTLDRLRTHFGLPAAMGEVIWPSRPEEFFAPVSQAMRKSLRQSLGIAPHEVLALTAARLTTAKGINELIEAAALSGDERLRFVWVGDGPARPEAERALAARGLEKRVILAGHRNDMPAMLDAADIFILPSHGEGMPLAAIEAMAKGLPLLAGKTGGVPEAMGNTGRLLPSPRTEPQAFVSALVANIDEMAGDVDLRMRLGVAAKARALANFRAERMNSALLEIVRRALFPKGDYVSPNLPPIRLDRHFPFLARTANRIGNDRLFDARAPSVPFLDRDEAHVLYAAGLAMSGQEALVIGNDLGWSTAHLAAAGMRVTLLSPGLLIPDIRAVTVDALKSLSAARAGMGRRTDIEMLAMGLEGLAGAEKRWPLAVIHEPAMEDMAALADSVMASNSLVFCPFLTDPRRIAPFQSLREAGWRTMILRTSGYLGMAWRGKARPVSHVAATRAGEEAPGHLSGFELEDI